MTKLKQQTYNKEFLDNLKNELKNIDNFTIDDSILYLKSDLISANLYLPMVYDEQ